jgi:5-methyltetrahydrofolate--homocysteine methyltransferase
MEQNVLDAIKGEVLLADGAIGTELLRLGLESGSFGELWNVERPNAVRSVYEAYCEAGARLLTTNSFRANPHSLASHHLEDRVVELNREAAKVAREAAAGRAWVLGSIGPFGGFLEPLGQTTSSEALSFFTIQAGALLEGGADGIVVETMTAVEEVEIAIRGARAAGAGVIVAMMTFGRARGSFRTMMGVSPEQAVKRMEEAGADIVGSNCGDGLSMEDYVDLVRILRSLTEKPVIIRPNAGRPNLMESEVQYRQTPTLMASQVKKLVRAGANIIGGCCGTTPEHIRLFGEAIRQQTCVL